MITEIILNLLLLTVYAIITVKKENCDSIPYKKLTPVILLPTLLSVIMWIILKLFPYNALILPDNEIPVLIYVIYYGLSCTANAISCCFIYKTVTGTTDKLGNIWLNNFKPWNRVAVVMILLGCIFSIIEYNMFDIYSTRFVMLLLNSSFLSRILASTKVFMLMKLFNFAKLLTKTTAVGSLIVPLFSHPKQ